VGAARESDGVDDGDHATAEHLVHAR
jgi:hypothetical protein